MILSQKFYQRNTLKVAQDLLGCVLVRKIGNKVIRGIITETEAYKGENDLASHASKGRTPRTELMFGEAGRAYIYLIYGMYHCLNIVTEKKDYPAAVLIRGVEIIKNSPFKKGPLRRIEARRCLKDRGICKACFIFSGYARSGKARQILLNPPFPKEEIIKLNGPGKVCKFLQIDKKLNGWDLTQGEKIWIERPARIATQSVAGRPTQNFSKKNIMAGKRVGVDYAKHCKDYLWRFWIK